MTCQRIQRKQKHLYPSPELTTRTRMHAENHQLVGGGGTSVFRQAFCVHAASQAPSQRPGSVFRGLASRVSQLSTQTRGTGLRYHVLGKQSKATEHEPRHQPKNKNTEKNNTQTCPPPRGPTNLNSSRGVMFAPEACFMQALLPVRSSPFRGALVLFCSFQKKTTKCSTTSQRVSWLQLISQRSPVQQVSISRYVFRVPREIHQKNKKKKTKSSVGKSGPFPSSLISLD